MSYVNNNNYFNKDLENNSFLDLVVMFNNYCDGYYTWCDTYEHTEEFIHDIELMHEQITSRNFKKLFEELPKKVFISLVHNILEFYDKEYLCVLD